MSSFVSGNLYVGQSLRDQLKYAERQVVELEKDNKKLKEERDWFEFKVEMLEKQLVKYQTKEEKQTTLLEPLDLGKYESSLHAERILDE